MALTADCCLFAIFSTRFLRIFNTSSKLPGWGLSSRSSLSSSTCNINVWKLGKPKLRTVFCTKHSEYLFSSLQPKCTGVTVQTYNHIHQPPNHTLGINWLQFSYVKPYPGYGLTTILYTKPYPTKRWASTFIYHTIPWDMFGGGMIWLVHWSKTCLYTLSKYSLIQGGHAQVKVKFPVFSLCLQLFPVFFKPKKYHILICKWPPPPH